MKFWAKLVIVNGRKMTLWTACLFSPYLTHCYVIGTIGIRQVNEVIR